MSSPTASHETTTSTTIISSLFSNVLSHNTLPKLQDLSASAHNYLVDKLSSACDARKSAKTSSKNAKLDWAWIRWVKFLTRIEVRHDESLENFAQKDRIRLLGAFAPDIREQEFSRSGEKDLASDTCQEAVDKGAEVFRENHRPDPCHELSRNINDNLRLQ